MFYNKVNESEKYQYPLTIFFLIKSFFIYIFSFFLYQEKFNFSAKSLQFNENYSHARVFTLQLYINRTVKKLNQASLIKQKFFSRDILDSKFIKNTVFRHNYGFSCTMSY